ncbi:uncharacterized protein LOC126375778 [Pectinophora gossypiella]|uniref:uncharacterized protein LOC126375778 n=1 Tax=Pectinophora gossypiella TaxID=13191 RepID=UPI00214EE925|nr:uncharacterized protein LOC126375778 [Pectinophora gossypiella]
MLRRTIILLSVIVLVCGEISNIGDLPKKGRMIGVETIHEAKIDKDTVVNRNLAMQRKSHDRNVYHRKKDEDREPDWSYSSIPKEVSAHVEKFKRNMTECLKEVQANDKRPVRRMSPKTESPVHGECLIACVFKRNGVIDGGKINKANLLTLVNKFYAKDTKLMKKLEKNVDRCIETSISNKDECLLAARLNECTNDLMASNKRKIVVNYK